MHALSVKALQAIIGYTIFNPGVFFFFFADKGELEVANESKHVGRCDYRYKYAAAFTCCAVNLRCTHPHIANSIDKYSHTHSH
jgi:hypothetical protein